MFLSGRANCTPLYLASGLPSSALCPNIVCNDLDQLDILLNITLVYYIDDVMQFLPDERKVFWCLGKTYELEGGGIEHVQFHGPTTLVMFLGVHLSSMSRYPLQGTSCWTLCHTPWKKEAQCSVKLFGLGSQYIPHLSVLLWPIYKVIL